VDETVRLDVVEEMETEVELKVTELLGELAVLVVMVVKIALTGGIELGVDAPGRTTKGFATKITAAKVTMAQSSTIESDVSLFFICSWSPIPVQEMS